MTIESPAAPLLDPRRARGRFSATTRTAELGVQTTPPALRWQTLADPNRCVLRLTGIIVPTTLRALGAALEAALDMSDACDLVVDLTAVDEVNPAAAGVLNRALNRVSERGGRLAITGVSPRLAWELRDGGLDRRITLRTDAS